MKVETFATLDAAKGIEPLLENREEEMPLPAWYRAVYHTPLADLTIEDLSKATRQQIHVEQIVPRVIESLEREPLAGEMFDGELLVSLRSIDSTYWRSHRTHADSLKTIIGREWDNLPTDVQRDAKEILLSL